VIVDLVRFVLVSDVQLSVQDPHGHGHMVAELFEGSVGSESPR
jgi:hypothetical protein